MMRSALAIAGILGTVAFVASSQEGATGMRTMQYTTRSADEARTWQTEVRQRIFSLLKMDELLKTGASVSFDPQVLSERKLKGARLQEISIRSTEGRRITVALAIPAKLEGKCPAVVAIHGHVGSRMSPFDAHAQENADIYKEFGKALVKRGFIVIAPEVGQHEVYEEGRSLMGERLWDCMRCVDYLASLPEVNKERIGCAGLSLGGEMAMWLGAMDTRVKADVSAGYLTMMDHMEQNHCMCWKFDGLRELVDWPDVYSLIAPRPLMCQNGLKEPKNDFIVPLAQEALQQIRLAYTDLGAPNNAVLDVHDGAHEIDLPALLEFLEKNL